MLALKAFLLAKVWQSILAQFWARLKDVDDEQNITVLSLFYILMLETDQSQHPMYLGTSQGHTHGQVQHLAQVPENYDLFPHTGLFKPMDEVGHPLSVLEGVSGLPLARVHLSGIVPQAHRLVLADVKVRIRNFVYFRVEHFQ